MSVINALQQRNSHSKLIQPGPDAAQLEDIVKAGLRAPDHGRLRPWHFVAVQGDRREALGELFAKALKLRNPTATDAELAKAQAAPLRAPLIVAGLVKPVEHPKVPRVEQVAAVACALHGMSLAAESQGFGAMWRTGWYAQDAIVIDGLGGVPGDEVIGFLYLGSRKGDAKPLLEPELDTYLTLY
ncbi:MAG: nitroreductase family protein [Luminiphilus sp.]|jgi:nitroreductase|nr:nitroreductase family protein [Luminiphilus sp.]MDG2494811.1 nitroreductase family protein [Luminiphilus sp.]